MTPEAKAREIAREWYVSFADPKNDIRFFSANMRADFVEKQIVQALRDVERETLERAAKLFREARVAHHTTRATNGEIPCAQISILADIDANEFRSLLQKEGE